MTPRFSHIDTWIFDLDLTLYPPEATIMQQIRDRIAAFVENHFKISSAEAHQIRHDYWRKYGTTLGGLMAEHDVDPHAYLDFVHDVNLSLLSSCDQLREGITTLPGRKIIFTNADAPYARRVLAKRGLEGVFEDIYDIHRMEHRPKPDPKSYESFCSDLCVEPKRSAFVEDSAHNLAPAKALGMTTIWVKHDAEAVSRAPEPHIDHVIEDVADWLHSIQQ